MKILFLDDSAERSATFLARYPTAHMATTASAAIELLNDGDVWNAVFLDHDLGGETFVDSDRPDCGMEVVRWVKVHRPVIKVFYIHNSWNIDAAHRMVDELNDAGYVAKYVPWGTWKC